MIINEYPANSAETRPCLSSVSVVGDLELDRQERSVRRAGKLIKLKGVQFRLLDYLMRHEARIVSRTMLLEHVWGADAATHSHFVESHMSRLRAKVDRGYGQELIQTVRGIGYRIDDLAR
jgi:two-component system, OmpR family, response regulator